MWHIDAFEIWNKITSTVNIAYHILIVEIEIYVWNIHILTKYGRTKSITIHKIIITHFIPCTTRGYYRPPRVASWDSNPWLPAQTQRVWTRSRRGWVWPWTNADSALFYFRPIIKKLDFRWWRTFSGQFRFGKWRRLRRAGSASCVVSWSYLYTNRNVHLVLCFVKLKYNEIQEFISVFVKKYICLSFSRFFIWIIITKNRKPTCIRRYYNFSARQ